MEKEDIALITGSSQGLGFELAKKLDVLERKYDHQFKVVFDAIRELTLIPEQPRKRIGIKQDD